MAQKLLHKRSSQALIAPTGATLDYGEIAVNYNVESPFLSIKNSDNTYSKFSSDDIIAAGTVEYVSGELKGYSVTGHTHDDRYYTETEINTKLAGKSDTGHTHTKTQITDFAHTHKKSDITDFAHTHGTVTLTGDVSGSADFTNTGTSISVIVKDDSHTHDGRYYTETEVDAKIKTVNDTIANRYGFSNVKVGTTTLAADSITDTVEFKAGDNIVLSATESADTVTVGVKSGVFAPISHDHDYSEIKNTPTSLKNPNAITFATGATTVGSYDGSTTATIKIPSSTTHLTNDSGWITVADKVNSAKVADSVAWANVSGKVNATTATTGIAKLVEGDLSGVTATTTGQAASSYHTHSQYAPKSHTHGTIKLQGDVTGSADFTNAGATINATVANDSHTHGTNTITGTISAGSSITSSATGLVQGKAVYEYAQPKGNYQAAGDYAEKEHSHTITASATTDDVVVLSGTSGTNAVTYTASHATQGPNTTGDTATVDTTTAQSPAHGGKIELNIPKITVNKYGHVTGLTNQAVAVTLPSDSNTHYTTRIYAGASGTAENAATSNPYLKVTDDNTYRNQVRFVGGGATTVNSDASGNITISTPVESYKQHEDTSSLSGSYGTTTTNGSHAVKQITVDALGHVTGIVTGTTPNTTYTFTNKDATLAWGTESTIATVGGTDITVTMPANPNTHYQAKNIVGATSDATSDAAATNGNVWLNLIENSTVRSNTNIKGAGATTVISDSAGTITISTPAESYKGTVTSVKITGGTGIDVTSTAAITSSGTRGISINSTYQDRITSGVTAYGWGNHASAGYYKEVAATTGTAGTVQLSSAINSSSESLAATPKAVKTAYDLANGKWTATNATTATTGIVKLVTGDMNGKSHADGQAPSLNHTHSQYSKTGHTHTITASATTDDVVVLSGTSGTNAVTYTASHAKQGPSSSYTTSNSTTTINGSGASGVIKIPQITVNTYGHVTAAADESVTITMPTLPTSLKNPYSLTVGSKTYNGSSAVSITASDLGLGSALKYCGVTTTDLTDGATTNPITIKNGTSTVNHTATAGCVVFNNAGTEEFVFNGTNWELLGRDANYKVVQTAVSDPTASGSGTTFISSISQDANGVITASKKNVNFSDYQPKGNYKTTQTAVSSPTASTETTTTFIDTISQNTNGVITATKKTLPSASTSVKGIVKLSNAVTGTSTTLAATEKAVKTAYDLANGKWTYNAETIKGVKVNNATYADSAGSATDQTARNAASAAQTTADGKWTAVTAKYNTLGIIKPSKSYTGAATLTTAAASTSTAPTINAITTTTNRYYAVEVDNNGVPFVNVPWSYTDTATTQNGHYTPSTSASTIGATSGNNYIRGIHVDSKNHVISVATGTPTNTHYTSKNIVGTSTTATTNGSVTGTTGVYLNHLEESAVKSTHKIIGSGSVKVTSDSNGNITINGLEYCPTYHVATTATDRDKYGYGSTNQWGHVKLVNGDLSVVTGFTAGLAAAHYHNHDGAYLKSYTESYQGTLTGITVTGASGLTGTGTISKTTGKTGGTITLGHATKSVSTTTPTGTTNLSHEGTFVIPTIGYDSYGHVSGITNTTYKLPSDNNTWRPVYNGVDSTSTESGATANAVKTAYDLAASKWTYNAETIKTVKVNNAVAADKVLSAITLTYGSTTGKTGSTVYSGNTKPTVYIPTKTSHITNDSGYITSAATVNNANNLGGAAASSYATQTWVNNKNYITSAATVAAANKLATARTLWGQSFDGTANVTGAISSTGNITPSTTATYELGTSSFKYKNVNVSNNVNVGSSSISYNATTGCLEIIC